jgi:glycosyltransferase involved in cell wall biosynthesis
LQLKILILGLVMIEMPFVTVVIPTYNYEKFIVDAIESIFASDYPQNCIEVIVIDDGSTDNTANVLKQKYAERITYKYIDNSKKLGAVRLGIHLAKGKYVFNLDADDLFEPQKIRSVVEIFEQYPEVVHVSHINKYWNVHTGETDLEKIPAYLLNKRVDGNDALCYLYRHKLAFGAGSTYSGRTEAIQGKLNFSDSMGTTVDEYLAIITMALGYSYFIGTPLTKYRRHDSNDSMLPTESFVDYHRAVNFQVRQDPRFSDEFKVLYTLKSLDLSLYTKKISRKSSYIETLELFRHLFFNIRLLKFNLFIIIWYYRLFRYLIPSALFLSIKRFLKFFSQKNSILPL